jgi:hypothetical protein
MLTFQESGEAYCEVVKVIPKVDSDGGGICWDVDVAYGVTSEDEAEMLKAVFPSALTAYMRAVDGKSDSLLKATMPEALVFVDFALKGGETLFQRASAEVRGVEFKCNQKQQTYTAKLKLKFLRSDYYVGLVQSLGEFVVVRVRPQQQDLPLSKRTVEPKPGNVVCAESDGKEIYGVFKGMKYGEYIVEDFGIVHTAQTIYSVLAVADAQNEIEGPLFMYQQLAEVPTWTDLVASMMRAMDAGTLKQGDDGIIITDAIAADAIPKAQRAVI